MCVFLKPKTGIFIETSAKARMPHPFLSYLQLFGNIPAEDAELILTRLEERTYKEGDRLFRSGHICREMFFIACGVLRIVTVNDSGNEVTYFFSKENQLCTLLNSFNKETIAEESIVAATDVTVSAISRTALLELYRQLPYLEDCIEAITRQRLLDKIETRNAYLGQDAAHRYRLFLIREPDIALRVSLSDIASYLGITPQSLSRIRRTTR